MSEAFTFTTFTSQEWGKRSGQWCIRNTRITLKDVREYLAGGMSEDEILVEFPELRREDFRLIPLTR